MVRAIAATRLVFGDRMSVQAPPNLTPQTYGRYLDAGINDWGGVSPVTPDHVNPEMPWPAIDEIAAVCADRGFALRQRLPVYPHYVTDERAFVALRRAVDATSRARRVATAMGLAREERWYAGEGWTPVLRAAQPAPKRRAIAMAVAKPALTADAGLGDTSRPTCAKAPTARRRARRRRFRRDAPRHPWHERCSPSSGRTRGPTATASRLGRAVLRDATAAASGGRDDSSTRAHQGERLDLDEVARLFRAEGADLEAVLVEADEIRREMIGDGVTYVVNRNITYTNYCHTGCSFCGFARPIGHDDGYYFAPDEVGRKAREAWELGATEVCIQGGIHPHNTGEIYLEIAHAVKDGGAGDAPARVLAARDHGRRDDARPAARALPRDAARRRSRVDPRHGGRDPRHARASEDHAAEALGRRLDRPHAHGAPRRAPVDDDDHVRPHRRSDRVGDAPARACATSRPRPAGSPSSSRCRSSTTARRCSCAAARGRARPGASA